LTALIHDLGKILYFMGEPQWAVVGVRFLNPRAYQVQDTFPVGCQFADKIVYHQEFSQNPDSQHAVYSTRLGIYKENCGLDAVHMSWGHDEYLFQVVKDFIPSEAAYMIRFHSFYAAHREGCYDYLMNDSDRRMMKDWVCKFNPYGASSRGGNVN
jgi:inositol oxygenase